MSGRLQARKAKGSEWTHVLRIVVMDEAGS